jgi:hypothetical protein
VAGGTRRPALQRTAPAGAASRGRSPRQGAGAPVSALRLCKVQCVRLRAEGHERRGPTSAGLRLHPSPQDRPVYESSPGGHGPRVDQAVISQELIAAVVTRVLERLAPESGTSDLHTKLADVERELAHLIATIKPVGHSDAILAALRDCEQRRSDLRAALDRQTSGAPPVNRAALEAQVRERVTRWQEMLTTHTTHGRQLLTEVLDGKLAFTPEGTAYRFDGDATVGPLLRGTVGDPIVVPVRGFERRRGLGEIPV